MSSYLFLNVFLLIIPLLLFMWSVIKRPTSLFTGALFCYILGVLAFVGIIQLEKISSTLAYIIAVPLAILLVLLAIFGVYAMIIALFWNERVLLKYEKKSFANYLPLILATGLLILSITEIIQNYYFNDIAWIATPFSFVLTIASYFIAVFFFFGITAFLYNILPIRGKVDYIIILGAGLNKDKVTPLLASRIDAGVKLYYAQYKKHQHKPTIILSGGQGHDEAVSEAFAMSEYMKEKYPDITNLLLEDQSTNTEENLRFSEQVAKKNGETRPFNKCRLVLATNNYHLLRAGKLAKLQGLNVQGVGAKTRLFYLPTAFIREYIGYLVLTKKKHIIIILLIFVATVGAELVEWLLGKIV
ncbi:YdcF family protein [Vagococcus xieshaowenii]|uniref:YdcF family protein n=1 Tax=Vagococcus xieshaowenii TaxID=2562451 RepID=A0AAJ5EGM0_9ENTE|nr:YdcF family protein [Vagococcus xieshaowenii]QCA28462.1 YdcF family protein [Vagococcus xieshaowenii]TFZ42783.1 YdcF family protein [Vagococcus xieshaowenii]